jgi:GxxExxY protein
MTRKEEVTGLIYKEENYAVIGACKAVYKDKGWRFLEPVYHECLQIEFEFRGIQFLSKPPHTLKYRDRTLVQTFSPDFSLLRQDHPQDQSCFCLVGRAQAQVLNYLAATACKLGLLVNFGHYPRIEYERLLPKNS